MHLRLLLLVLLPLAARGCQQAGASSCCCGKCSSGYKVHSAKTFSATAKAPEVIDGLELWSNAMKRANLTTSQLTNPNFLFARCCAERELPRECVSKCSHHTYTQRALHSMYLRLDACPVSAAAELHFCAAQGRDHRECCARRGVGTTQAGERCLRLCDQRPDRYIPLDLSYAPCQERFEEMKSCFFEGVRESALSSLSHSLASS